MLKKIGRFKYGLSAQERKRQFDGFSYAKKKIRASLASPGIEMRGDWGKPLATRLCPW